MRSSSLPKSFFVVAAIAAFCPRSVSAQQADVKTENGVRVVRDPSTSVKGPDGKAAAQRARNASGETAVPGNFSSSSRSVVTRGTRRPRAMTTNSAS